jgi:hypothetical protein
MSRLTRVLVLGAMLAAMALAGATTAVAAAASPATGTHDQTHQRTSQDQLTSDSAKRAALAQERYYSTWSYGDPAVQRALAQERYYSTWSYGDTPAPAPAQPSGRPGWLVPVLGVLAGVLALLGVLAAMLVRRARGRVRVHQAA